MRLLALPLLCLVVARGWAEAPPLLPLSSGTAARMADLEGAMAQSPRARRLLAQTGHVSRRQVSLSGAGAVFRYDRGGLFLAVDSRRLDRLEPWQAELALARELARADLGLPIELKETEMAAYQAVLAFALERAEEAVFRKRLVEAVGSARGRSSPPLDELGRIAYFLVLFRQDPALFYKSVENSLEWTDQAVGLTELEDFLEKHEDVAFKVDGAPYVRLGGRRYRSALVFAAGLMRPLGGRARLREALGPFDSSEASALFLKVKAFWGGAGLENRRQDVYTQER